MATECTAEKDNITKEKLSTFVPANQAYFSLPNILRELPALNEDKNVNDNEGKKDVDLFQICTSWSFEPEDFMNGQH